MTLASRRRFAGNMLDWAAVLTVIYGVVGLISGIAVTTIRVAELYGPDRHRFIGLGIGLAFFAVVGATLVVAVLKYRRWQVTKTQ